jgi:hypothetical protein
VNKQIADIKSTEAYNKAGDVQGGSNMTGTICV